MNEHDVARLLDISWRMSPLRIEELTTGVNNATYLVSTSSEDVVLKRYRNLDAASRLPFEQALLQQLADANLPFAVPAPVPDVAGSLVASGPGGELLVLTRRIPGEPGWRGDLGLNLRAGRVLAVLDRALARVELPPGILVPEAYPHLDVSDARIARGLDVDPGLAREIGGIVRRAERQLESTTAGWPTRIIHTDFFPPNVLVDDGEITGVIDFEFAGLGHVAMDFAIGLVAFGTGRGTFVPHLDRMEAFAAGYFDSGTLSADELSAIPALLLFREAGSFVHWLGRMEEGVDYPDDLRERGQRLLDLDAWLSAHGNDLVARLHRIRLS